MPNLLPGFFHHGAMSYTQYLKRISISLTTVLCLVVALVVYVDPFQIFHKSYIPGMGLSYNQRYQNAGLINSYLNASNEVYDSVMIGTSLSENFTGDIAANAFGWRKALRLFISGGTQKELVITLEHALNTHRVQHVLWELNPRTYTVKNSASIMSKNELFPSYLYNKNFFDDLRYVFNIDILKMSWDIFRGNKKSFGFTPDTMGYWGDQKYSPHDDFNSFLDVAELAGHNTVSIGEYEQSRSNKQPAYPVIDEDIIPLLEKWCNTNVEFVLFNAPISKMGYMDNPELAYHSINMANYLLKHIQVCQNIRIHAFDTMEFTSDLNNYQDPDHYELHISKKILERMGKHQNIITAKNVNDYENAFIKAYDEVKIYTSYPDKAEMRD
jgi:hypothetical protein